MNREIMHHAILNYQKHLNDTDWMIDEAYKFEFANFLQKQINFKNQSDEDVLKILLDSQTLKYGDVRGVQFIQKSGRVSLSSFVQLQDIALFRQFETKKFESIDWKSRTMSFTALSAWLTSLFPEKIFPIPTTGIDKTISYLFDIGAKKFPKTGAKYVSACQDYMLQTQEELKKNHFEDTHMKVWRECFSNTSVSEDNRFNQVDWNWLVQDFHLFVFRKVLNLYNPKLHVGKKKNLFANFEPIGIEGQSKLATHMRYERDNNFIKQIKKAAFEANHNLNCEVCGFSFYEKYGELGLTFIEAHHKNPLNETKATKTKKDDIGLVCSNCHRMLHKGISQLGNTSILTIHELKDLIQKSSM